MNRSADVARLRDGKLLALASGDSDETFGEDTLIVARYLRDGSLDTSFDRDGLALLSTADDRSLSLTARRMAVQRDGKILVVAEGFDLDGDAPSDAFLTVVARFNADGSVDRAFGTGERPGVAMMPGVRVFGVGVMTDGRIVVAGATWPDEGVSEYRFAMLRLTPSGRPDRTFSGNGFRSADFGEAFFGTVAQTIILSNGSVYASGTSGLGESVGLVARYDSNGEPDRRFSGDGVLRSTEIPAHLFFGPSICASDDGQLFIASTGFDQEASTTRLFVTRVNSRGAVDRSFGERGVARTVYSSSTVAAAPGLRGSVVILTEQATFRFGADGTPDPSYPVNGAPFSRQIDNTDEQEGFGGNQAQWRIVVQTDGKPVVSGGNLAMQLLRQGRDEVAFDPVVGALFVDGTDGPDRITLTRDGNRVIVTRNGRSSDFPVSGIRLVRISVGEGDDVIDTRGVDLPLVTLFGDGGGDTILGGAGDETMMGGDGSDSLDGGAGHDNLDSRSDSEDGEGEDDDTIAGGDGDDRIAIGGGRDIVSAGAGKDSVFGAQGNATIRGGDGNDFLVPGGASLVLGGAGDDQIIGSYSDDTIFGGDGDDDIIASLGSDSVRGDAGNDLIRGHDPRLTGELDGPDLRDRISGGAGNDTIDGGAGSDLIDGGEGDDSLAGGAGHDRIFGQSGIDHFRGGKGNDIFFAHDSLPETIDGGTGNDSAQTDADDLVHSVESSIP